MTVLWTLLAALGFYIMIALILPIATVALAIPFISLGRAVRPLQIPLWLVARYGVFALEVWATIWVALFVGDRFDVWMIAIYVECAFLLWGSFQVLYQFDLQQFQTQSGIWYIASTSNL